MIMFTFEINERPASPIERHMVIWMDILNLFNPYTFPFAAFVPAVIIGLPITVGIHGGEYLPQFWCRKGFASDSHVEECLKPLWRAQAMHSFTPPPVVVLQQNR